VDCVVGIDLSGVSGGTRGRTAAACIALETPLRLADRLIVPRGAKGDRILLEWTDQRKPRVVAIDAPLSLPHSVTCADPGCPRCQPGAANYLGRDVDSLVGGMPTVMLAAIAFRGIYLARMLRGRGYEVIETYPAGSYAAMGITRDQLAKGSRVGGYDLEPFSSTIPDEVDAVCAALAAVSLTRGYGSVVGGRDGEIVLAGKLSTRASR
jgi:predicted nuclease with RNAse H fold